MLSFMGTSAVPQDAAVIALPSAVSEGLQLLPRRVTIVDVPSDSMVLVLEYLRAVDLCSVSETDKTIFAAPLIRVAIMHQLTNLYPLSFLQTMKGASGTPRDAPPVPISSQVEHAGTDVLYVREVKSILAALTSPQPVCGKAYWIRYVVPIDPIERAWYLL